MYDQKLSAFSLILGNEHLDMRLSKVKGVWGGDKDWDPGAGDEVESGELGARPPFNFATFQRDFVIGNFIL